MSTVNLGCKLDLKTIALRARNAEYNPKVREMYQSSSYNGSVKGTGCGCRLKNLPAIDAVLYYS